jgi:hypothetical protein
MSKKSKPGDGTHGLGDKGYHVAESGGSVLRVLRRVKSSLATLRRFARK